MCLCLLSVKGRCYIIITKSVIILPPGPSRRFKRICELIQSMLLSNRDRHLGVAPQRRISADLCSDSSSSSYSSMDRVSPTPQDEVMLSQHSTSTASLIETIRSSKLLSPYKFISRQNINHWFFLSHHRFLPLSPPRHFFLILMLLCFHYKPCHMFPEMNTALHFFDTK